MYIVLKNNLSKQSYKVSVTADMEGNYYLCEVSLPKMPDGLYTLSLIDDDENEIFSGLSRVGDFQANKSAYNAGEKKYIQYGD